MGISDFKARMLAGERMAGTFVKVPSHEAMEYFAASPLDFICLDGEHAAIDRNAMDACLAVARALDFPVMVRVASATPENMLQALDSGAVGLVCPHIDTVEKAQAIARAGHFGLGGRGFAGATRWAGLGRNAMKHVLAKSRAETVILAQIEEPAGVDAAAEIAAVDGIDGLFIGPADLSVSYGKTDLNSDELLEAFKAVGEATRAAGKAFVTFVPEASVAKRYDPFGVQVYLVGSDLVWLAESARTVAEAVKGSPC